jgi:hypothetical protein
MEVRHQSFHCNSYLRLTIRVVDFCLENGVRAYPQITLYKGGNLVEVYKGARDFDILQEYINKNAEGTPHSVVPHTIVPPPPETHHPNPAGDVLVLDSTNFNKAVTERPIFVKFFAPWCVSVNDLLLLIVSSRSKVRTLQATCSYLDRTCTAHAT